MMLWLWRHICDAKKSLDSKNSSVEFLNAEDTSAVSCAGRISPSRSLCATAVGCGQLTAVCYRAKATTIYLPMMVAILLAKRGEFFVAAFLCRFGPGCLYGCSWYMSRLSRSMRCILRSKNHVLMAVFRRANHAVMRSCISVIRARIFAMGVRIDSTVRLRS